MTRVLAKELASGQTIATVKDRYVHKAYRHISMCVEEKMMI